MITNQEENFMKNTGRKTVRIVSFLSAVIVALAVWAGVNSYKLSAAKKEVLRSNERALTQLGTHLDDINLNLQKCTYSNSKSMLGDISAKLWRSSASAKENLAEITDGNTEVSGVYKFLSQVGEYTVFLRGKTENNQGFSKEETENLSKLLKYSEELSGRVNTLISQEEDGLLSFDEVKKYLQDDGSNDVVLGEELNDAAQSLEDYPTLIYDGPFSDHIQNKKSALIENLSEVNQNQAQEKAADFIGVNKEKLLFLSETHSNISTYNFYTEDCTVAVTKKGGLVCYVLKEAYAGEVKISYEEAIQIATKYLKDKGYVNIKDNYYSVNDGICTINFAYYENNVTYYTDLIKVSVALDSGEITSFDASGYIMNHRARKLPEKEKYTITQAKSFLKKDLQVISSKKAYIPTQWETEEYVYEYHCKAKDGNEVLVYIDPQTGEETDILVLLYLDGGILTK